MKQKQPRKHFFCNGDFQQLDRIRDVMCAAPDRINTVERIYTVARSLARGGALAGSFRPVRGVFRVLGRFVGPRWRSPAPRRVLLARAARALRGALLTRRHPLLLRPRTAIAPSADASSDTIAAAVLVGSRARRRRRLELPRPLQPPPPPRRRRQMQTLRYQSSCPSSDTCALARSRRCAPL